MGERYPESTEVKGTVTQILDRGVVVDLEDGIEGFVPLSQLGWDELENPADVLRSGDELPLRVIEVVPSSRRIVLSVRSYFNGRPMEELDEFRSSLEGRPAIPEEERVKPESASIYEEDEETGETSGSEEPAGENEEQAEEEEEEASEEEEPEE